MHQVGARIQSAVAFLGVAAFALMGVLYAIAPHAFEVVRTTAPHTPSDVELFGGTHSLGQSFIAPDDRLAEIRVALQPPVPGAAFPMLFHLRHGRYSTPDLRTVIVTSNDLDPDGTLRIRFAPVEKSGERPYVFILEAGNARPKQLAAYRQIDSSIYDQGYLFLGATGKVRAGDLEFAALVRQPRLRTAWNAWLRPFLAEALQVEALQNRFVARAVGFGDVARAVGFGMMATAVLFITFPRVRRFGKTGTAVLLTTLAVTHIALHAPFLLSYPGVNDEGSYLMDIQNIRAGYWPFRDTLAKGPLFLLILAPVALFLPHTLLPGRLLAATFSGLEVILLYVLGRNIGGRPVGILAAVLWALSPITVTQTSQLFQQPFTLPLITLALILLVPQARARPNGPRRRFIGATWPPELLAGILLALAYLVRASSLAFLAPAVLLCAVRAPSFRTGCRTVATLLGGYAGTLASVAAAAYLALGPERTAIMFNLEALIIGHARAGGGSAPTLFLLPPAEILERFAAHGAVLFRLGTPLVLLWFATITRTLTDLLRLPRVFNGIGFLGVMLPLLHRIYRTNFTLSGDLATLTTPLQLLVGLLTALVAIALFWEPRNIPRLSPRQHTRTLILLLGTWLPLIVIYIFFGRFRQQYHMEFLPWYILGSALFLARLSPLSALAIPDRAAHAQRGSAISGTVLLVVFSAILFLAFIPSRVQPHAGSIPHQTALDVARILRAHSAPGEEILTAQGLFTFYADRFLPFGAAHPGWYLEERAGTVPTSLRRIFFPDKDVLRRYVEEQPIRLVAIDRRTREVYFSYDPAMQELLRRTFRLLETLENPREKQPIEIWIRK